jgi:PIN domain nuclease of toxin-antitoxin system
MVNAVVADTHALIFHAEGGKQLGPRAARLFASAEQRESIVYIPAAVMWEFSILVRLRRIHLQHSVAEFFHALFSNPAYQSHDLTPEQIYLAAERQPNNDPFDALICAAAQHLSLPLVTRDAEITDSGFVRVIW